MTKKVTKVNLCERASSFSMGTHCREKYIISALSSGEYLICNVDSTSPY